MADGHLPIALQYFQAIGPTAVALAVAVSAFFIQYNQWKTAKDKLKIDLFDRRMKAFHTVDRFVVQARGPHDDLDAISEMQKLLREARYIFDEKTYDKLDVLYQDYINLRYELRENEAKSASQIMKEKAARNDLFKIFRPWLELGHIK